VLVREQLAGLHTEIIFMTLGMRDITSKLAPPFAYKNM